MQATIYQTTTNVRTARQGMTNIAMFKRVMNVILAVCCLLEMVFFPGWDNFTGCVVSLLSTALYNRYIFRIETIRRCPVAFVAITSLFLFMYLALPGTLLDGNPMSHNLYNPIYTYVLQVVYFALTIAAFHIGLRWSERHGGLRRLLKWGGYYTSPTDRQLWALAVVGWVFKLTILGSQGTGEALAGKGSLSMFAIFLYAPICICFKHLYGRVEASKAEKNLVYGYIFFCSILLIGSNSRSQMLSPFVIWGCGYVLSKIYERSNKLWLSPKKFLILLVGVFVVTGPLSDMALAMVLVRGERKDITFTQLLSRSVETFLDKELLAKERQLAAMEESVESNTSVMSTDWNESYTSNIFLQRFCNYRVVDASIYHAGRAGYANPRMQKNFIESLQTMFPGPISAFLFGSVKEKANEMRHSSQDMLYAISTGGGGLGGYRVGGDVGLGLAVFSWLYFPLVLFVYSCQFFIFDSLTRYVRGKAFVPFFVLMNIYFSYFLTFTVAGGIIGHVTSLLWGTWWTLFWTLLTYKLVRMVVK